MVLQHPVLISSIVFITLNLRVSKKEKHCFLWIMGSLQGVIITFISILTEAKQMFLKSNLMSVNKEILVTSGI